MGTVVVRRVEFVKSYKGSRNGGGLVNGNRRCSLCRVREKLVKGCETATEW
jgi:hypothetical protein